jgi:hypothetical protein
MTYVVMQLDLDIQYNSLKHFHQGKMLDDNSTFRLRMTTLWKVFMKNQNLSCFRIISYLFQCYEKSCSLKPHYLTIRAPKQLIYNYTTSRAWKYEQLINKMPH